MPDYCHCGMLMSEHTYLRGCTTPVSMGDGMISGDFNGTVWRDRDRRGGRACLDGTRFTIAQLIAEFTKPSAVAEVADNLDLDKRQIQKFFNALCREFDAVDNDIM